MTVTTPFVTLGFLNLGPTEMIVLGVVMLLLFGSRLPSVMRNLGRGVTEFKKGIHSTDDDLKTTIEPPANPPTQRSDESQSSDSEDSA
jgi:sec-independent protein translocase protein TatA